MDGLDLPSGDQAGPGGEGYRSGRGSTLQMGQTTLRPTARASSWDPLAFWFRSALRRCASIFCFPRVIPPPPLPSQSPVVSSSLTGDRIRIGARPGPSRESLDSSLLYLPEPSPAGIPGGRTADATPPSSSALCGPLGSFPFSSHASGPIGPRWRAIPWPALVRFGARPQPDGAASICQQVCQLQSTILFFSFSFFLNRHPPFPLQMYVFSWPNHRGQKE